MILLIFKVSMKFDVHNCHFASTVNALNVFLHNLHTFKILKLLLKKKMTQTWNNAQRKKIHFSTSSNDP